MIQIDGSRYSGSGTLLRYAAALCTLRGEPLHLFGIRTKRAKPGLRPQHLQALRACCRLCSGNLEGDAVGSREIFYRPGGRVCGGTYRWDIGTAGSTTMLAFTLLCPALFATAASSFTITGGLFQDFAPSAYHMQKVLLPTLAKMGVEARLEMVRPGYVPKGQGLLKMTVSPVTAPLAPLEMVEPGSVKKLQGVALSSHLEKERVSERMAVQCRKRLNEQGYAVEMQTQLDSTAVQRGAALLLWAETQSGFLLGADQAGKPGRRSEAIADYVTATLLEDLQTGATTDRHLADQLILFGALAKGRTTYLIPKLTEHIESNLWLVNEILGARGEVAGNRLSLEGIGFYPTYC